MSSGSIASQARVGSVPYPLHDWTRVLYFIILLPHILLAALIAPFVLILLYHALKGRFDRHARLARRVWPAWSSMASSASSLDISERRTIRSTVSRVSGVST